MKKLYIAIIGITVFAAAILTMLKTPNQPKVNLGPQTNKEGAVVITITPMTQAGNRWDFKIALDTHSEELTADLTKTTILIDENGREYMPISWEGDLPGGHHREGVLKFGPISQTSKTIELIIRGIGGMPERKFMWTILF